MSENANSSIDTATEDYKILRVAPVISPALVLHLLKQLLQLQPRLLELWWMKTPLLEKPVLMLKLVSHTSNCSDISTKNLFDVYGVDGFTEFKSKEEYWKDSKVQKQFSILMGLRLKCVSIKRMTTLKKEFANFQLGQYQRSQTGHELIRDDLL
jgi:hypothetical protein